MDPKDLVKEAKQVLAKNKKIIESYFEFWEQLPEAAQQQALENNGYIHSKYLENSKGNLLDCIEFERMDTYDAEFGEPIHVFRPKSLQGIEDNNGWIKIESEDDLPKDYQISYHAWNSEGDRDYYVANMWTIINRYHLGNVTHYQPIEKPKPPVY